MVARGQISPHDVRGDRESPRTMEKTMFAIHGLDLLIFALTVMLALAKLMKTMM